MTFDPIRAEISGSDTCTALGVTATADRAVLAICRELVRQHHDPARPLHAYRGDVLCLKVRSIGEGAAMLDRSKRLDPDVEPAA